MESKTNGPEGEGPTASSQGTVLTPPGVSGQVGYPVLVKLLKEHKGGSHLVILQGTPDPDAISSAMALSFLGEQFDIETTIFCFKMPSHHENRALIKRLGIKLVTGDRSFDVSLYSAYSIVDSQKYQTDLDKRLAEAGVQFLAFVDHHREDLISLPAAYVDIRENVGSTAAIFCEYLREAFPKGLEPGEPAHVCLATALMHGIRSDTSKFLLATRLEYEASAFLAPCIDNQVIEAIEQPVLSPSVLTILENALVRRRVHDNFMFSDVGFVRSAYRDGIPQAAELLLTREGTDTVLVFGVVDEETIDGSFRTRSQTINPDEFLKSVLGVSPESGKYYGGGNVQDRGGFQIQLGFLGLFDDKEQLYAMAKMIIEKAFLDHIGLKSDTEKKP